MFHYLAQFDCIVESNPPNDSLDILHSLYYLECHTRMPLMNPAPQP